MSTGFPLEQAADVVLNLYFFFVLNFKESVKLFIKDSMSFFEMFSKLFYVHVSFFFSFLIFFFFVHVFQDSSRTVLQSVGLSRPHALGVWSRFSGPSFHSVTTKTPERGHNGLQLLCDIVSITCSNLLRSRCLLACSSFSSAVNISSLYLVM